MNNLGDILRPFYPPIHLIFTLTHYLFSTSHVRLSLIMGKYSIMPFQHMDLSLAFLSFSLGHTSIFSGEIYFFLTRSHHGPFIATILQTPSFSNAFDKWFNPFKHQIVLDLLEFVISQVPSPLSFWLY